MPQSNILPFINIDEGLREILNELGFSSEAEDIAELKNMMPFHKVYGCIRERPDLICEEFDIKKLVRFFITIELNKLFPTLILPFFFYSHDLLENDLLMLMCERLRKKRLKVTVDIVQQMTWKAMKIFYERADIKTMEHAVNIVIKTYQITDWITPKGCPSDFIIKNKIQDS